MYNVIGDQVSSELNVIKDAFVHCLRCLLKALVWVKGELNMIIFNFILKWNVSNVTKVMFIYEIVDERILGIEMGFVTCKKGIDWKVLMRDKSENSQFLRSQYSSEISKRLMNNTIYE